MLAIASSYMQEKGDISHPEDAIFIRQVTDAETKPKWASSCVYTELYHIPMSVPVIPLFNILQLKYRP